LSIKGSPCVPTIVCVFSILEMLAAYTAHHFVFPFSKSVLAHSFSSPSILSFVSSTRIGSSRR
jgi:hypothetical protein